MNERIEQQAIRFGGDDDYEFICECASRGCLDRVALTLGEYEGIRAVGTRFVVKPGHENDEIELVVAKSQTYNVVEKDGPAGIVADLSDPRDGDESARTDAKAPHVQGPRNGEGGIRTLDGDIHPHNALAGRRLQPLGHFSGTVTGYPTEDHPFSGGRR